MKEKIEYDDEGYELWHFADHPETKIRGLSKQQRKQFDEMHERMPILIEIPRPNLKNKKEILRQVEIKLETLIKEQSGKENMK